MTGTRILARTTDLEDAGDQEIQVLDSYTIPWDIAEEVIALTPTPEATVEGGNPDEGATDVAEPEEDEATAMETEVEG